MASNGEGRSLEPAQDNAQPNEPSFSESDKPIKLSFFDKIRRFFLSKEEFQAYLVNRELKRKAKEEARKTTQTSESGAEGYK